jgi:hypothetical protein
MFFLFFTEKDNHKDYEIKELKNKFKAVARITIA